MQFTLPNAGFEDELEEASPTGGNSGMSSELVQLAKRTATTSIATIFTPFFSNIFRLSKCKR
jgi:hypothetical protein